MSTVIDRRRATTSSVTLDRRVTSPLPDHCTRLTGPARAYLAVLGLRHGVIGLVALLGSSGLVATPALQDPVPPGVWGSAFVLMAVAAMTGVIVGNERLFRTLILVSFFLTAATAGRLMVGLAAGDLRYVLAPVFAATLALKDMVVSSMQVTAPLRDWSPEVSEVSDHA